MLDGAEDSLQRTELPDAADASVERMSMRFTVLVPFAGVVFWIAATATLLIRSRDPQAAMGCLIGPTCGVLMIVPTYVLGRVIEALIAFARRRGLEVDDDQGAVRVPSWGIAAMLLLAAVLGMWMLWNPDRR